MLKKESLIYLRILVVFIPKKKKKKEKEKKRLKNAEMKSALIYTVVSQRRRERDGVGKY